MPTSRNTDNGHARTAHEAEHELMETGEPQVLHDVPEAPELLARAAREVHEAPAVFDSVAVGVAR